MEQIIMVEKAEETASYVEKQAAAQFKKELDAVLDGISLKEHGLDTDYVKVGTMLEKVREDKLWSFWGHRSYGTFIESVAGKVGKGRTRLYQCSKVARELLPYIPPEELADVGISKASVLASAVKNSGGKRPNDALINAAKSPKITVQQMSEMIADVYGARDEGEKGIWYGLNGVFFDDSEKEEFERAVAVACQTDPKLPQVIDWHDAPAPLRKQVLQKFIMEYLGTYEGEVSGPRDEVFGV